MDNWPEFIKQHFMTVPFVRFLDAAVVETGRGRSLITVPLRAEFANSYGMTHGGVVAALVDIAAGIALRTLKVRVVTVETTVNYFLPVATDDTLRAEARLVHEGHKLLHAEVDVANGENTLVAKGRAVFYITGEDTGEY
ncbi:PaaI family thioesterase [Anaeroselena agilis]|uniref:PaaI family thioesterase n=1 Tax=Anaeroselena agilis TaxID=3063788 RepID=A0ABU3P1V5_9FIRM|nr:PaaI family thioesterase [Selenomonadales bacterium 4137-cl]